MSTAINIVTKALSKLRVVAKEQPLQASDRETAIESLNDMIQYWQAQYNHLWTMTEAVVLMEQGKRSYQAGQGGDRIVDYDELLATSLSSAAVNTDTTVTLASVSGVAVDDNIGVLLDSGAIQWTTVAGLSGNDVTINDALAGDAASGNLVYVYTNEIERPLRIVQARYADNYNESEIPLESWSRNQYFDQPDKTTSGSGSAFYYSPQLELGNLYIWPVAPSNQAVTFITYIRPFEITDDNADTVDFPAEWTNTIVYNLAKNLLDDYGVPQDRQAMIEAKANEYLSNNLGFDNPADGLKIELRRYY